MEQDRAEEDMMKYVPVFFWPNREKKETVFK